MELGKLAILQNGFWHRTRSSKWPLVENTHAFDTAFNMIFCRVLDDSDFKAELIDLSDEDLRTFMITYLEKGAVQSTYFARNDLLKNHFDVTTVNQMKVMNCNATIMKILIKVFNEIPSIQCGDANTSFDFSTEMQQNIFVQPQSEPTNKKTGRLMFIEAKNTDITFNRIPQVILLHNEIGILYSIVESVCSNKNTIYVAHIRRTDQIWYTFNNTLGKVTYAKIDKTEQVMKIHCLCYWLPPTVDKSPKGEKQTKKKCSTRFDIIENFSTYELNGTKINVNNACAVDAVLHLLGCIFKDDQFSWHKTADESSLTALLKAYVDGDEDRVYYNRVKLLIECNYDVSVINFSEISLNCAGNVFNAIQRLCTDQFPSAIVSRNCGCGGATVRKISTVEIDFEKLMEVGINDLSSCVLLDFATQKIFCKICQTEQKIESVYCNLIFLDLQPMKTSDKHLFLPSLCLKSIPSQIDIGGVQYTIKAAIEYRPTGNASMGHYVAHCRKNGDWYSFDDTLKSIYKSKKSLSAEFHALVLAK